MEGGVRVMVRVKEMKEGELGLRFVYPSLCLGMHGIKSLAHSRAQHPTLALRHLSSLVVDGLGGVGGGRGGGG